MTPRGLVGVIALGLIAGAAGAWWAQPSRAEKMLLMFRDICLPMAQSVPFQPPENLIRRDLTLHHTVWIDRAGGMFLTGGSRFCTVDDRTNPIPDDQIAGLEAALRMLIATDLPQLRLDSRNELNWDRFLYWHSGQPAGDPERWVVSFARIPKSQGQATMLSLNLPRSGPPGRSAASGGDI